MLRRFLLTTVLALTAFPALARENYALLIGASDYQNIEKRWSLKGPKNDMELVAKYLLTEAPVLFAAENVTVLTDKEGADPATLGNIRAAFADLTAKAQPGDFIYLHLSGHGTRAPALDPEAEPDGLDELFLPVDIGSWNNTVGTVENALVDDEIGQLLDGLRAKGADVWIVLDSCHSGTATRAIETEDDVMMRQLDPSALGISDAMLDAAIDQASALAEGVNRGVGNAASGGVSFMPKEAVVAAEGVEPGGLVAFYAAQSTEMTPEMRLPRGAPDRKSQGVFTFTLFETLAEYPGATYGQVAQEVLRKYALRGTAKSTPLFEGDLDRVVFGGEARARVSQWPATLTDAGFKLNAGTLHGLAVGTELAVMAAAADGSDKALGLVRVTSADTFTATTDAFAGEVPEGVWLRREVAALDFSLTVALPPEGSAPAQALSVAMADLREIAGPRLSFVTSGSEADLALAVLPGSAAPDALWILPGTGLAESEAQAPKVETAGLAPGDLAGNLHEKLSAIAKAVNLMKLGAALGPATGPGAPDVTVELLTRNADHPVLRGLPLVPVPELVTSDEVHILAKNNMDQPVDVNVLYIGADYSITHFYAGRLHPGEEIKKGLFAIGGESMGQERMVVVMTPAAPHSKVEDLSWLAQDAVRGTAPGGGFAGALYEAGFGQDTRGAIALTDDTAATGPGPAILQVELRTRSE